MSVKKEVAEQKLKEKYAKSRVTNYIRLGGSLKNNFYADLKRTGFSENKLHLDIIRLHYETKNKKD